MRGLHTKHSAKRIRVRGLWADGSMNGSIDGSMDGPMDGSMGGSTDGSMDRWMDRRSQLTRSTLRLSGAHGFELVKSIKTYWVLNIVPCSIFSSYLKIRSKLGRICIEN